MHLFVFVFALFMRLLVVIFFVGIVGSSVVVALSFIEDLHELLGE
jgi:hypothetical protein